MAALCAVDAVCRSFYLLNRRGSPSSGFGHRNRNLAGGAFIQVPDMRIRQASRQSTFGWQAIRSRWQCALRVVFPICVRSIRTEFLAIFGSDALARELRVCIR